MLVINHHSTHHHHHHHFHIENILDLVWNALNHEQRLSQPCPEPEIRRIVESDCPPAVAGTQLYLPLTLRLNQHPGPSQSQSGSYPLPPKT
ncbi:uncharacterized protein BO72DRAFT_46465 [Aspergillus fijiensis CBS 313.89]|uniref:Uncharacterized protein n=1 Tax=Aspergillus fijiensis CBS 313.89 TaxID=1448319 RepID=A0A8G1RV47_9EURO|nr:uncharacterized protein BO72DRAFT_46465 [Aspergillus fijiensis CBS 313.89]RAK79498.1 hypothetical protein BO72DRAFT_46465 [Aspergillus fijiensis CBS 313.89]